jgi:hypothetical protein
MTRSRSKERIGPGDLAGINRQLDTEVLPAVARVQGVRSVQAYNSITGELVFILDVENLATIDRLTADTEVAAALSRLMANLVRTGGEVLFDRPTWQGIYGRT